MLLSEKSQGEIDWESSDSSDGEGGGSWACNGEGIRSCSGERGLVGQECTGVTGCGDPAEEGGAVGVQ